MKIYSTMENGIKIVEYQDELAPTIADMWNRSRDGWGGGGNMRTAESIRRDMAGFTGLNCYIALNGDEAVGYCTLYKEMSGDNALYVGLLNVRTDFHGQKLGKELVLTCVRKTIELGYPRLDLNT